LDFKTNENDGTTLSFSSLPIPKTFLGLGGKLRRRFQNCCSTKHLHKTCKKVLKFVFSVLKH
jgi:hypothetical protein